MITPQVMAYNIQPMPTVDSVKTTEEVRLIEPIGIQTKYTKEDIRKIVEQTTTKYNVPTEPVWQLIGCETGGTYDTNIQSSAMQKYGRELSFGLPQIHLPAHPNISEAQAKNPHFGVEFICTNWEDRADMWVTCTKKLQI